MIEQEVKQKPGRFLGGHGEQEGKTGENGAWELGGELCEGVGIGHTARRPKTAALGHRQLAKTLQMDRDQVGAEEVESKAERAQDVWQRKRGGGEGSRRKEHERRGETLFF